MSPFKNSRVETFLLPRIKAFIEDLDTEEKATAFAAILKLQSLPHSPKLAELVDKKNRIFEVRASTSDFWIRMFWFYHKGAKDSATKIVLTNGYLKKQNKTDPAEIKLAIKLKSAYEKANKK